MTPAPGGERTQGALGAPAVRGIGAAGRRPLRLSARKIDAVAHRAFCRRACVAGSRDDVRDRRVGEAVGAEIDARVLTRRRCGLRDGALQAHGGGVALLERRGVLLRRLCLSRALGVHRSGPNPGVGGSAWGFQANFLLLLRSAWFGAKLD